MGLVKTGRDCREGDRRLLLLQRHYSPQTSQSGVQDFIAKYKADYGQIPDHGLAAFGYDAAKLLFDAMQRRPRSQARILPPRSPRHATSRESPVQLRSTKTGTR